MVVGVGGGGKTRPLETTLKFTEEKTSALTLLLLTNLLRKVTREA